VHWRAPRAVAMIAAAMTEPPAGTVTFLFADVEGSTRLLREHGERYAALRAAHRRASRRAQVAGRALSPDDAVAEALRAG
jgi:class 3 adenylate cyclase